MKNNSIKHKYSPISNRIFSRYIRSILILFLVLVGGFFLAWFICRGFVWYEGEWLYELLKTLQALAPIIVAVGLVVGVVILTYTTVTRPLRYLDEVIGAAKELASPTESPIILSDEMLEVQNELNLVREQALRNIQLVKESEQRKNDLIMYLAHDLKTPLASVIGYLNLLHDEGEIPEELREKYLSISLEKAERLEDLINEFFEIARFNLSNITLQYSRINLTRLLEQLVYEFKPMLQEKNLHCNLRAAEDMMLKCDVDKIQRVFDNLLRNAVLYSYAGTGIELTARVEEDRFVIQFANQGDTIPKEKLERIFEQFYRLDASRSTGSGGAGLGLAIAKQIVALHKGTITAESENERIVFTVILPVS